jgi:hypothetical protein
LTSNEVQSVQLDSEPTLPVGQAVSLPSFTTDDLDDPYVDIASRLTDEEEDALLKVGQNAAYFWLQSNLIDC